MLRVIDTHCHLDQLGHPEQALENAANAGVEAAICVGTSLNSNQKNLAFSLNPHPVKIFLGLGIHPANIETETIERALQFIRQNIDKAVCVGEIGLDFWQKEIKKNPPKKAEQEEVFRKQLALAKEFSLPVSIHSRGSWQRCLELLKESGVEKAVFHWYSGPVNILQEILAPGFFISATPALMYSPQHQEAVKSAPIERIFLETDSPVFYGEKEGACLPARQGFSAEPKDVFKTLSLVAELKNLSEDTAAERTTANAKEFFNI